jgi:lysozyme
VLVNMAFNMGGGLLSFVNTLAAIQRGDYNAAANGMLASRWATQVGARATRLADMMRNGA